MERGVLPIDSESQVGRIIGTLTAGSVISTLVVALRCFTRTGIIHYFGYEDVFIILSQVMTIGVTVLIGLGMFSLQGVGVKKKRGRG